VYEERASVIVIIIELPPASAPPDVIVIVLPELDRLGVIFGDVEMFVPAAFTVASVGKLRMILSPLTIPAVVVNVMTACVLLVITQVPSLSFAAFAGEGLMNKRLPAINIASRILVANFLVLLGRVCILDYEMRLDDITI
jgi:hypothetical protein